jgi:hypothetical protein
VGTGNESVGLILTLRRRFKSILVVSTIITDVAIPIVMIDHLGRGHVTIFAKITELINTGLGDLPGWRIGGVVAMIVVKNLFACTLLQLFDST